MKKIPTVAGLMAAFMLGSCLTGAVSAEQEWPLKIWFQNNNGAYNTLCVVDEDTGVNYVVVSTEMGNGDYSCAISPRYNADGSLYTTGTLASPR